MNIVKEKLLYSFQTYRERPSITYLDKTVTYKDLYQKARRLADALQEGRYSPVITVFMNRGIDAVIAVVAAVLAEKAFCAIDVHTPRAAIRKILEETESNAVITDAKHQTPVQESIANGSVIQLDSDAQKNGLSIQTYGSLKVPVQTFFNEQISHVIYTSGSTNVPKGVLASKQSLIHFLSWEYDLLKLQNQPINTAQISTPWFDPYARDVFLPLFHGGCICIPNKREMFDAKAFFDFSRRNHVNVIHIVPTLFRQLFLNQAYYGGKSIDHILLAGEMVCGDDVKRYLERFTDGKLYNLYGPTETTMSKFFHPITPEDAQMERIHVGGTLPDTFCKIIDDDGNTLPFGQEGEIAICTKYASLGYLKRPKLNRACFFDLGNGVTEYRTRDMGVLHGPADLEIVGRKDNMKKIYGQKVHSEEIEAVALQCPGVKNCVSYVKDNKVYAVIEPGAGFAFEALQKLLCNMLHAYKIPEQIIIVKQIPLNKNGKVDRKNIDALDESYILERIPVHLVKCI